MIQVKNAQNIAKALAQWRKQNRAELVQVYKGIVTASFNFLVYETPQWTGSAASNWNISLGQPDFTSSEGLKEEAIYHKDREPFQKGHPRAIAMAAARAELTLDSITKLSDVVHISNAAENLSGESYIAMLEANPNAFLRPENEPGHMLSGLKVTANFVFAGLTKAKSERLKKLRLGEKSDNAGLVRA